jgi:hypothetical protein
MPTKVRLTRKFANMINGIDLSRARTGEEMLVSARDAEILVAEGWAVPIHKADDKPRKSRKAARRSADES